MPPQIPNYLSILFAAITLTVLLLFFWTIRDKVKARLILICLVGWLAIQAVLSLNKVYYSHPDAFPPKLLVLGILPGLLTVLLLMVTKRGRSFVDSLPLERITWINTVRVAVELGLLGLYYSKAVPRLMTFEGGNLDILSGLTAPLVVWFGFIKKTLPRKGILIWNIICLGLLINIVVRALLSTPLAIQKLAFDQPNIAILVFPIVWLPTFIVPMVLFGHLVSLRQLIRASAP